MNKVTLIITVALCVSAFAGEPDRLTKKRNFFLGEVIRIQKEANEQTKKLSERYIDAMEKDKIIFTKKGDLEGALAFKAEIEKIKATLVEKKPEPQPQEPKPEPINIGAPQRGRAMVSKVVIYNLNYPRRGHDGFVEHGTLVCYDGIRKVLERTFKLDHKCGGKTSTEIEVGTFITKVKVICVNGGPRTNVALAEVQILTRGGTNIAKGAKTECSSIRAPRMGPEHLLDGNVEPYDGKASWWQAADNLGWVEITL